MRSSSLALAVLAWASCAEAQRAYPGFLVERFAPSPAGAGWLVADALDMRGGVGGALALTVDYARAPLRLGDGGRTLAVVSDQVTSDLGAAITLDRMRFSLDFTAPIAIAGDSGAAAGYAATAPSVDLGSHPDTLSDVRLGLDVRLAGSASDPVRVGGGAALVVPSGDPGDYDTDGTYRGQLLVEVAGDAGHLSYAAHAGLHLRLRDEAPAPEAPRGHEFVFAAAAGARIALGPAGGPDLVVGPELFGATALRDPFEATATALEVLLGARVEETEAAGTQLRFRAGVGAGLDPHFGAPEWRLVLGVEMFNRELR